MGLVKAGVDPAAEMHNILAKDPSYSWCAPLCAGNNNNTFVDRLWKAIKA